MGEPVHIKEAPDLKVIAGGEQSSGLTTLSDLIIAFKAAQVAYEVAFKEAEAKADGEGDVPEWDTYEYAEIAIIEYPCRTLDDVRIKARFFLDNPASYDTIRNCSYSQEETLLPFLRSLVATEESANSAHLQHPANQNLSVASIPQLALAFETYKAAATLFGGTLSTPLFGGNGDEMMERSFEQAHEAMSAIADELQKRSPATQRESDIRRTVLVLRNLDCGEPINPPLENDTAFKEASNG